MIHYNTHVAHTFYKIFEHLRYFLGGHRPSETSILAILGVYRIIRPNLKILIATVIEFLLL